MDVRRDVDVREVRGLLSWLCQDRVVQAAYDAATAFEDDAHDRLLAIALAERRVAPATATTVLLLIAGDQLQPGDAALCALEGWRTVWGDDASIDPAENYGAVHPEVARRLRAPMTPHALVAEVAQHDPRLHELLRSADGDRVLLHRDPTGERHLRGVYAELGCRVPPQSGPSPRTSGLSSACPESVAMQLVRWVERVYGTPLLRYWRDAWRMVAASLPERVDLGATLLDDPAQLGELCRQMALQRPRRGCTYPLRVTRRELLEVLYQGDHNRVVEAERDREQVTHLNVVLKTVGWLYSRRRLTDGRLGPEAFYLLDKFGGSDDVTTTRS